MSQATQQPPRSQLGEAVPRRQVFEVQLVCRKQPEVIERTNATEPVLSDLVPPLN